VHKVGNKIKCNNMHRERIKKKNKWKFVKYVLSCSTTHQHVLVPLPKTTASNSLPSNLPALHALVSSDLCYSTHLYLTNRYVMIMTTIPTAMLFFLQGMYQIYPTKKVHKHTQFYLLFRGNITSTFTTIRST